MFSQRRRQLPVLVEMKRAAGTCDDPCILCRVLESAFMQARMRLRCNNRLIYTGHHMFRRHASPARAVANGVDWTLVRSSIEEFFSRIIRPNSFFATPEGSLSSGVRNASGNGLVDSKYDIAQTEHGTVEISIRVGLTRISSQLRVSDLGEWRHICHFFRWQKIWRVTFVRFLGRMWHSRTRKCIF